MKGLIPQDTLDRLDRAEASMVSLQESMERLETLVEHLIEIQQEALDVLKG